MKNNKSNKIPLILSSIDKGLNESISIVGIITIIISLGFFIGHSSLTLLTQEPYDRYDYKKIEEKGIITSAKIIEFKTLNNIIIYGKSPILIKYQYHYDAKAYVDKFKTMDLNGVKYWGEGEEITIKVYKGQSIIQNLKPYRFPVHFITIIPAVLGLIGFSLLFSGIYISYKNP